MRIGSLTVMVGRGKNTKACNIHCPFCISKMTPQVEEREEGASVPLRRMIFLTEQAKHLFDGARFGIISGKGEPVLAGKERVGEIVEVFYANGYVPELQTNGTLLDSVGLNYLQAKGLNTVALSCVSHLDAVNSQMLSDGRVQWNLGAIVREARDIGLLVRLTVIVAKGGVENLDAFLAFAQWAKETGAHQLTFRRMGEPRNLARPGSKEVAQWIREHFIEPDFIIQYLSEHGTPKDLLPWARQFTFEGMSVVVTDCMSPPKGEIARHAVIQPDGHLYLSWDDPGDIYI